MLEQVKNDPVLKVIPVVVLTSSAAEADVRAAYRGHANAYVTKPVGLYDFLVAVRSIEQFWFSIARTAGPGSSAAAGA